MGKNIFNRSIGLMVVCLALVGLALVPAEATAKTYKIATGVPDGVGGMKRLRQAITEIARVTEGRVKFKLYPGGVQGDDFTVVRKMRIGQLHGGVMQVNPLIRFYTDLQIYNMPLQFQSYAEVDAVRKKMDEGIRVGLKEGGLHVFPLIETGFAYLLSKKPVANPKDMINMKVWIPKGDPLGERLVKMFDVSPVPLGISDVLAGLQTGLLDALAIPPSAALALQLHNHVEYVMDLPLIYIYTVMVIDQKIYTGFSEADKVIVSRILDDALRDIDGDSRKDNLKSYQALLDQGIKSVSPSADDLGEWDIIAEAAVGSMLNAGEVSATILEEFEQNLMNARTGQAP
ncbi:MAG: TRAP transporter substrate-binding protein DctP [Gammaproteobacteria bacterium]|jgi:TRAP-type transport system periplasmic protein|nr:TRAP transporter substrate-binding protein DctP [Gammaproteobacteria bacterium]MBT5603307.1 TRAP transporter substrate-binding protein DctP [Gammaproteobacteria bacterium]